VLGAEGEVVFLKSLPIDSLLAFAPATPTIDLRPLNVLIGANGSGKSNLIEAVELLRSTPTSFASAIRDGGGVREWLWKGNSGNSPTIDARLVRGDNKTELRYYLEFTAAARRASSTPRKASRLGLETRERQAGACPPYDEVHGGTGL
jgi:predicted ATPase